MGMPQGRGPPHDRQLYCEWFRLVEVLKRVRSSWPGSSRPSTRFGVATVETTRIPGCPEGGNCREHSLHVDVDGRVKPGHDDNGDVALKL